MKQLMTLLSALAVTATVAALFVSPVTLAAADAADGKTLFVDTHKCNMCHGVAAAGIEPKTKSEKTMGPDLSGFKSDADFATLAAYARKTGELDGKTHKKEFKGTDEELKAIFDWLGSLPKSK